MGGSLLSSLQLFPSCDVDGCTKFYQSIGFKAVPYLDCEEPHVCLYRDDVEIVLVRSSLERIVPNRIAHGYGYDAYFISRHQEELLQELRAKGVTIVRELGERDYKNREFVFEDPEGRWIAIGCKD